MSRTPSRKRASFLWLTLAAAVGLLFLTAWSSRDVLIEVWHLHRLESGDLETKRGAIAGLGQIRSRRAIPELEALVRENDELAVPALVSLVRIGPASLDALRRLLELENREVFDAAIAPIGELGKEGVPVLLPLLGHQRHPPQLSWAGKAVLAIGEPAASALAEILLEDTPRNQVDRKTLCDAITILAQLEPEPGTISALSHSLLRSENSFVRQKAAGALGAFGPSAGQATGSLLKALADEDQQVANAAAVALSRFGTSAIPSIALYLNAENHAMRMGAIFALGEMGAPAAVPHLIQVLQDDEWRIRLHAVKALRRIGKDAKTAVPALRERLSDPHSHVRNAAARALETIEGTDA